MKITVERTEKMNNKSKANKRKSLETDTTKYNKHSIKSRSIAAFVISLLFFIISFVLKLYIDTFSDSILKTCLDSLVAFIESISGIVLGLSLGSMLLDFFSYIKYAQERIREVIIDKEFLNTMSDNEKKRIISSLESSLYFKGQTISEDSLYSNIKNKVIPLLEKEYFVNYHTHIDCEIINDKIYKTIYNDFSIYSENADTHFKLPFAVYFSEKDIKNIAKPYTFKNLLFNGEKIDISDNSNVGTKVNEKFNGEKRKFKFQDELPLKKGENKISYVIESVVDINDNVYSKTFSLPCKNFTADFQIKNDDYNILAYGFAIDKTECVKIKKYRDGCRIVFSDWILPGDGCIFIINRTNPTDNRKFRKIFK